MTWRSLHAVSVLALGLVLTPVVLAQEPEAADEQPFQITERSEQQVVDRRDVEGTAGAARRRGDR